MSGVEAEISEEAKKEKQTNKHEERKKVSHVAGGGVQRAF